MTQALAAFQDVDKVFDNGTVALRRLNLSIREGEFLALLGPSGCGKSTALRLLAGLAAPSEGALNWRGGEKPEIGFVFQEPTLMPWASVAANVYLPLRLAGVSRAQATPRIDEALEQVGLSGFRDAYPRELSGGMRMRVSVARAFVTRPKVLLMDEPFAALDEITRAKLNDDLVALKCALGTTVVFVTHSVFESVYLANRIVVMAARPGRAVADIVVPEPLPRGPEFRLSASYADTCRKASAALQLAMGSA